jgi:hypothetical protein
VFRRSCAELASFPEASFGEDYEWISRVREKGGKVFMLYDPPESDMVIKIEHGDNTSKTLGLAPSILSIPAERAVRERIQKTLRIATPPSAGKSECEGSQGNMS